LREAIAMLEEEGLANVFARHDRHAEATRRAVRAWGLEVLCLDEREYSSSLTAILAPDSDRIREIALQRYDLSLGTGLGKLKNRVFRIGHLGWFNDLMLCGTLCGVEMALGKRGGVDAALEFMSARDGTPRPATRP
jgi:alanine-glyoxylate transaminase/serine-glyoxylate transaminase/serine-pyruvate transaminase